MLGAVGNLAPSDKRDVLVLEELAEVGAGEEIEIALAPCGAPSVAFASGGVHFCVIVGEVDDEFVYAGLHVSNCIPIEVWLFCRQHGWFDGDGVVDYYIFGAEGFLQIREVGKPVAGDEERQFVFVREAERNFKEFLTSAL